MFLVKFALSKKLQWFLLHPNIPNLGPQKKKATSITYLHSFLLIYPLIIVGFITQFVLVKPFGTPKFYKKRNQGFLIFIPILLGIFVYSIPK